MITHSKISHSVGLLWTSDRPVIEACVYSNAQHSQETNIPTPVGCFPLLLSCLFYPLCIFYLLCPRVTYSTTIHNTNIHASRGIYFCIFLYSVLYPYLWLLLVLHFAFLSLRNNTLHKHRCPRRDSNPQTQQAIARIPSS